VKRIGKALLFAAGVALLGAGVPLAWLWVASRLQHSLDALAFLPLAVMLLGMLGTYLAVTVLANRVDGRRRQTPVRRNAWTRSLSAERKTVSASTPTETMFITATVLVGIAFEIWLFVFAGSSLPTGTG
jgi:hypothetical protein